MTKKPTYRPDVCEHCGQTKDYIVGIDKGSVMIVRKVAQAVARKGINAVHTAKEGVLNHNELCNVVRPRNHGLIAHVKDEPGVYCLTTKGADFLKGKTIPKYAIVSKAESRQIGYFEPETYQVNINQFTVSDPYWEGFEYYIKDNKVLKDDTCKLCGGEGGHVARRWDADSGEYVPDGWEVCSCKITEKSHV